MRREPIRKSARPARAFAIAAFAVVLVAWSCATGAPVIPEGISSRELIQKAQERSDAYDWKGAKYYYTALQERFGDDPALKVTAMYELAFIDYKQGKTESARAGMRAVLDLYEAPDGASLPGTWKILAEKVLSKLPAN